jgi:hypothetical protein
MENPCVSEARDWLKANPTESVATASRIFKVPRTTLQSSITRLARRRVGRGGQNKVLTTAQFKTLKKWIIQQYKEGLGATRHMTYAAICHLIKPATPPSQSWLTKFIRNELQDFHIIKTKPIAQQRSKAQSESTVT